MGEAKRREFARELSTAARKRIVGLDVDADRRVVIIRAQGPLDLQPVEVELLYCQLKHIAGQLQTQEAELERMELAKRVVTSPPASSEAKEA